MTLSLVDKIYVTLLLLDLAGIFILLGACLHMAYTQMDLMLGHLRNCKAVAMRAPLRHCGVWGNLLLVGGISGLVTFPKLHIRIGLLDEEDLRTLPTFIKRKLALLQWSLITLVGTILTLAAVVELGLLQ
jgi:hypothetical protein